VFRFDGVRFESVESVYDVKLWTNEVISLKVSQAGGLWIGYRFGGVSYLHDGKMTHYQYQLKGDRFFPSAGVRGFAEAKDGTVWAITDRLNVFKNGKWEAIDEGIPRGRGTGLLIDRRGGVWAAFASGLFWRHDQNSGFKKISTRSTPTQFAEAPDGTVWAVTDAQGLAQFDASDGSLLSTAHVKDRGMISGRLMFDRDGNLWCASFDGVLQRLSRTALANHAEAEPELVEAISEKEGLTGGVVTNLLQDREGNVWVTTSSGIDRFREAPVSRVPVPVQQGAVVLAIAAADHGKMWVTDWNGGLFLADKVAEPVDGNLKNMSMMYRGPSGRLWMGNPEALWVRENGTMRHYEWPLHSGAQVPQAVVEDAQGGLWVSLTYDGVFRFHNGTWTNMSRMIDLGNPTAYAMAADAEGNVWLSYGVNTLLRVKESAVKRYGPEDGLNLASIVTIVSLHGELWLGGTEGTMHFDGKRFQKLSGTGNHIFKGVSGIVPAASGDLWLNGDDGIIRIPSSELAKWKANAEYGVAYEKFDFLDGVVGKPKHSRPVPTAMAGTDGRLWFAIGKTLMMVDPATRLRNSIPPPVKITEVDIDGVRLLPGAPVVMQPGAQRIEINFASLSLSVPEQNRYRYRMIGADDNWSSVNASRSVAYTNLAPGSYRFEVSATNNDGVWSTSPAYLRFEVLPVFYQTWWFRSAAALLFILALWLVHLVRIRSLARRISDRLQSQQLERVRIARELHDTLLQGVGSLSLMVHTAINKVDREHPVVPFLSNGLKQAETVISEGRERVARLRVNVEAGDVLIDELGILGIELTAGSQTRFELAVQGKIRSLETQVADECRAIAREAIWNAVQHARAGTITLAINLGRRHLTLQVRDDGCGIAADVLAAGSCEGHWGLPGMRERAARIGGRLEIQAGKGSTVLLSVPARLAYKRT